METGVEVKMTSCARGDTICPRPARCTHAAAHLQSIAYIPYACGAQRALLHEYSWSTGYDHAVVHINHVVTWTANQSGLVTLTFDLLTLKVVSESRVTWATCANFGLPRPVCSRLRPDVRDRRQTDVRQTDVRQNHRLMPLPIRVGGIIIHRIYSSYEFHLLYIYCTTAS